MGNAAIEKILTYGTTLLLWIMDDSVAHPDTGTRRLVILRSLKYGPWLGPLPGWYSVMPVCSTPSIRHRIAGVLPLEGRSGDEAP